MQPPCWLSFGDLDICCWHWKPAYLCCQLSYPRKKHLRVAIGTFDFKEMISTNGLEFCLRPAVLLCLRNSRSQHACMRATEAVSLVREREREYVNLILLPSLYPFTLMDGAPSFFVNIARDRYLIDIAQFCSLKFVNIHGLLEDITSILILGPKSVR